MTDLEFIPVPSSTPPSPAPIYLPPKPKSPLGPILVGFFAVIILSALLGFVYFKAKFQSELNSETPSPSPTAVVSPSPTPSLSPSSTPLASPSGGSATPKSSLKPSASIKPSASPTPIPQTTLDIRFGNPSAHVKQTIDEGSGDGRVINREYTSIQGAQFDEVSSLYSPRVTTCFHIVANEKIAGKDVKFIFTLDDKVEAEDNLGQYDKLEAGRLYDWCHDTTTSIGKHTARLTLNSDKSLKEANYTNGLARVDWENLVDKIAPNISLGGPYDWDEQGTCFLIVSAPIDNVTPSKDLKIEQKIDSGAWSSTSAVEYCFASGSAGDSHSYGIRAIDARGNVNELIKTFVLY